MNSAAAGLCYAERRFADAIPHYDKAATVMENDYNNSGMIVSCYKAVGDAEGATRAARRALERAEKVIAQDPDNGSAMSFAVGALAVLGETERAKEWAERAMLLDPDNMNMKYNFACMLVTDLHDYEGALDLLDPLFDRMRADVMHWVKTDPDLDPVRDHPRFKAMLSAAETRLAPASD